MLPHQIQTKPPIPWLGGKRRLLKHIKPLIPEHQLYVELFFGGGALFFDKTSRAAVPAVLNDIDSELVNLYRVICHHKDEFVRQFDHMLYSREMYNQLKVDAVSGGLTDIQRAANFYARVRQSFAARADSGQSFGLSRKTIHAPRLFNFAQFEQISAKLKTAIIENGSWQDVAYRYDWGGAFFFADPPYWQAQGYKSHFDFEQYQNLAEFMSNCKGKVMLTINKHPEIEALFGCFESKEVAIKYSVKKEANQCHESTEIIYCNYPLPKDRP